MERKFSTVTLTPSLAGLSSQVGGLILYGQNSTATKHFSLIMTNIGQTARTLPNGDWNFYALGWTGANSLEGEIRCDSKGLSLSGGSVSLTLNLSQEGCRSPFFGDSTFLNGNQFHPLKVHTCRDLTGVSAPTDTCVSPNQGSAGSLRVSFLDFELRDYPSVLPVGATLAGLCHSFLAGGTRQSSKETALKLPLGLLGSSLPLRFQFFYNTDCSGTSETLDVTQLFSRTSGNTIRAYPAGATSFNQVFLKSTIEPRLNELALTVSPVYPGNGSNWNDYIKNDGADPLAATGTACTGSETGALPCLHGGTLKKVALTGLSSCSGLTMTDTLGVFHWKCLLKDGTPTFFTDGFKPDKSLRNLLSGSGWFTNSVTVSKASESFTSSATVWWSNTVTALPTSAGGGPHNLNLAGTIYVLDNVHGTDRGYNINADKVGLVLLSGAGLYTDGITALNCLSTTGESSSAGHKCLVSVGNQKFIWIEGSYDGFFNVNYVLLMVNTSFSQVYNTQIMDAKLTGSVEDEMGVKLVDTHHVHFNRVRVTNNFDHGLILSNANNNVFSDLVSSNNGSDGLNFHIGSQSNSFVGGVFSNNGGQGIYFQTSGSPFQNNTFVNITMTQNSADGLNFSQSNNQYSTFIRLISTNNGSDGIELNSLPHHLTFAQVVSAHNGSYGLNQNAENIKYAGNVMFANTTGNCSVGANTSPGMITATCSPAGLSTHTFHSSFTLASSFVGKATNDSSNTSDDASGSAANYPGAVSFDWFQFYNYSRHWGRGGVGTFPQSGHIGRWISGTGQIWDWSLLSSATVIRNTSHLVTSANATFTPGSACPSFLNGNQTVTDLMTTPNTFLLHAFEVADDFLGDNDGLCESNETCLYAPNFGNYQGHGDPSTSDRECVFNSNGGGVTNVTMRSFPSNGY